MGVRALKLNGVLIYKAVHIGLVMGAGLAGVVYNIPRGAGPALWMSLYFVVFPMLISVIFTIRPLLSPIPVENDPITNVFLASNLTVLIGTLILQILWGLINPFLPYAYVVTLIHLVLIGKTRVSIIYATLYTLILLLQQFNLLPIVKTIPEWQSVGPITKSIYLGGHLLVTALIYFLSKLVKFVGVIYLPSSAPIIKQLLMDGLRLHMTEHRIRNILNRLHLNAQTGALSPSCITILEDLLNLKSTISLRNALAKLEQKVKIIEGLFQVNITLNIHHSATSSKHASISYGALSVLYEIIYNAAKHSDKSSDVKVALRVNKQKVYFQVTNRFKKITIKRKQRALFSQVAILTELLGLGELDFYVSSNKTFVVTGKLNLARTDTPG